MKKLLLLIGCFSSLSLAAGNPTIQARVCQVDNFLAGCSVFQRAEGNQTGVPVDVGGTNYDLYLSWGMPTEFSFTDSIAVDGQYLFNCQVLTEPGIYTETLTNADGCDSIVTLTLTEYIPCSPVEFAYTDSIAKDGTYIFNCQVLTAPGTYSETLTKADGCDSTVTLTLTEYIPCSPVEFAYTDSIAKGGTYIFNCQVLTAPGTYSETLTKADGCDSTVTLTLKEYIPCSPVEFAYTDSIAKGGTYIFNCQVLTAPGTYSETLTKADGCDSTVTLTLKEYIPCSPVEFAYTDSIVKGGTYIFNCQVLTAPGTYSETLTKADGCDSTVTLTLKEYTPVTVEQHDTLRKTIDANVCYKDSFVTRLDTLCPTESMVHCDTVIILRDTVRTLAKTTIHTIDSIYIYNITVWPIYKDVTDHAEICPSELPYTWESKTWDETTAPGVYPVTDTLHTINGCDSIVTFTLTVWQSYEGITDHAEICPSELPYTWETKTWDETTVPGVYPVTETLHTINGCDSIVTFTLTVWQSYEGITDHAEICPSELPYTWESKTWDETTVPGVYPVTETLHTINGCDSIVTFTLTVWQSYEGITDHAEICPSELPYTWETKTWDETTVPGVYPVTETLHTINGCDSIVTFTLTVWQSYEGITDHAEICPSELPYTWESKTWDETTVPGVYPVTETLHTINGCDSIVTFTLTVWQSYEGITDHAEICQSELPFTWESKTWDETTVPGVYPVTETLYTINGCDSTVTFTLTVSSSYLDSLPALVKDDSWLLMIHRRSIREDYGINFTADQVHWYKVVGDVDEYLFGEKNDTEVGTGDYYTVASKMSGQYYALIDVDVTWLRPCALYARTVILDCDNPQPVGPVLSPTYVAPGGLMRLTNLAQGETQLNVFTPAGQLIRTETVLNETEHELRAEGVCGFYLLQVFNDGQKYVFKYVVTQ